jgi:hypothetical protein
MGRDVYPDEHREKRTKRYGLETVQLQTELDHLIKILKFQREALENEMMEGMGYKQVGANSDIINKLKSLTLAFEKATTSKIKFDTHLKVLAERMTPEEELAAVREFIRALPNAERGIMLKELVAWHNVRMEGSNACQPMGGPRDQTP